MPSAKSSPSDPVDTTLMSFDTSDSPSRMIEPLPNCFSIWDRAAASALALLSSMLSGFPLVGFAILNHRRPRLRPRTRRASEALTVRPLRLALPHENAFQVSLQGASQLGAGSARGE